MRITCLERSYLLIQSWLLVIALVFPAAVLADGPKKVSFSQTTGSLYLTPFVDILPDPGQSLTVHEVAHNKRTAEFAPTAKIGNSFGFTKAAYWIRFSLDIEETPGHSILLQLDSPLIDDVQFYIPDDSNGYIMKQAGEGLDFEQREITHRTYLFHLPHHGGEARTYYMRLQTDGSMHIPLYLWTHEAFIEHVGVSTLVLGGYLGFMLLLVLVTLAAYQKMHERIFLAYSAYLSSFLLLQLSLLGYGFQYFWPTHPEWSNRTTSVSVGLSVISGLIFSGMFLQVFGNKHSRIKAVFQAMMLCGAVSVAMSLFGNFSLSAKNVNHTGYHASPCGPFGRHQCPAGRVQASTLFFGCMVRFSQWRFDCRIALSRPASSYSAHFLRHADRLGL